MQSVQDEEWKKISPRNSLDQYAFLRKQYQLLRDDFHFNLVLLEERDRELDRYDEMTTEAATAERHRQEELRRLQLQVSRLEEEKAEDAEDAVLQRLQLQELKQCCRFMKSDVQRHREECDRLRRDFQQRKKDLEKEWNAHREEMSAAFHRSLQQQEHEYKLKVDQMQTVLMSQDLKIRLVTEQMDASVQAELEAKAAVKVSEEVCEQIQSQLKQKHQDMEQLTAAKDHRILMLDQEVKELKNRLQKEKDDHAMKFQKQLKLSLEMEQSLKQKLTQVELEWQERCDDIKAQKYVDNHQLIEALSLDRQQAKAELCEREQELQDLTLLLRSVQKERDQATQAHEQASEEGRHLQEQNNRLHTVINQMRKDMEGLTQAHSQVQPHHWPQLQPQPHHPETAEDSSTSPGALMSDLKKQEVGPIPLEFVPTGVMDQSALAPQLQQEKQHHHHHHHQQQASLGQTVGLSYRSAKGDSSQLYSRLKQAVSCIVHLNKQKQQLIEMGNCLRAQISSELMAPVKGEPGNQTERLNVLEDLQYQLTTKELQYVMRQSTCRSAPLLPGPTRPVSTEAEGRWFQTGSVEPAHVLRPSPQNSRHIQDLPLIPERRSTESLHMGSSSAQFSSEESPHSLTDVWKTLDHGLSPTIFSEGEVDLSRSTGTTVQMEVNGTRAPLHTHLLSQTQQKVQPSAAPSATNRRSSTRIRNYNIKH